MLTIDDALKLVDGASDAKRLFGEPPAAKYKQLARLLHPDTTPATGEKKAKAAKTFAKLAQLYSSLLSGSAVTTIGSWSIREAIGSGDIADLYCADSPKGRGVFKIAKAEEDNDLMESEHVNLGIVRNAPGAGNFNKYLPSVLDSLEASGRRANVLSVGDGLTLSNLMALFPSGIDFRHIVWMGNRAFHALGFIHNAGVVHGAILPEHLIYGPISHGLTVVDWCYSVTAESKKHIPARVKARVDLYPPEIARKEPAMPQADVYMLAASLQLAAKHVPRRFRPFFDLCLVASPRSRPHDAWELAERWNDLAQLEYGSPRYLPLEIPIT